MALQTTGPISLLDIQNEFGGSNPISLSEYYGVAAGIPASGTISINQFYGKSNVIAPVNTVAPTISGTINIGNVLTASNGTWTGTEPITFTYMWQHGTTNILDGTSTAANRTIQGYDEGFTLRVVITATNVAGSASAFSASTSVVPCRAYGTFLSAFCDGCTYYYRYADGSCGTYNQQIETNSQSCGCCPSAGQFVTLFCSGCDLYYTYTNGSCGTYDQFAESNSSMCGCSAPSGSSCVPVGCSGTYLYAGCESVYVTGTTGFGGWGCDGIYTDDSNFGAIAVQQGILSSGQAGYVTICDYGCHNGFGSCNVNGVQTNSWGSWCGVTCC